MKQPYATPVKDLLENQITISPSSRDSVSSSSLANSRADAASFKGRVWSSRKACISSKVWRRASRSNAAASDSAATASTGRQRPEDFRKDFAFVICADRNQLGCGGGNG